MTRIRTQLAAATLAAVATVVVAAAPAQARILDQFTWSFEETGSFDDCGFTIESDFSSSGTTVIRTVHGTDELWFASIAVRSEEVLTNPETGEWLRIVSRGLLKESGPATEVADGVFTHTYSEAGNPVTILDSDGKVVARDTGLLRWVYTFDTLSDGEPGGFVLDEVLVKEAGPHPMFHADWCGVFTDLIG
ncbi:hypothetical protein [Fodinibacter luteus]